MAAGIIGHYCDNEGNITSSNYRNGFEPLPVYDVTTNTCGHYTEDWSGLSYDSYNQYNSESLPDPDIADVINLILPHYPPAYTDMTMQPQFSSNSGDCDSDTDSVMLNNSDLCEIRQDEFIMENMSDNSCHIDNFQSHIPSTITPYSTNNQPLLPSFDELWKSTSKNPSNMSLHNISNGSDDEGDEESEAIVKKGKRGAKNVLLWKFLLDELSNVNQKHIRWISCKEGTFRFVDTAEISRMWGAKKRKSDMNFEKLSRGIRHYYKSGFMRREDGTRLVYKFNWKKVPREYRRRFLH